MKVLVCGGRSFRDQALMNRVLDGLRNMHGDLYIINGGAKGADKMSTVWAINNDQPYKEYTAEWRRFGKAAGPIRNLQMLNEGNPDLVVAFEGGKGTEHMVSASRRTDKHVILITNA